MTLAMPMPPMKRLTRGQGDRGEADGWQPMLIEGAR
jgi:hypothetical protein